MVRSLLRCESSGRLPIALGTAVLAAANYSGQKYLGHNMIIDRLPRSSALLCFGPGVDTPKVHTYRLRETPTDA